MAKMPVCHEVGLGLERLFARAFVVAGGLFWVAASFAAEYGFRANTPLVSARNALLPLTLTVVVFVLGMYNESITAALLAAATVAIVGWGVVAGWETGVWVLMGLTLIGPIATAGVLYFLAARMQMVCSLVEQGAAADAAA
ncbi:MAG TPA: hypothetical protein VGK50_06525 [Coriobacteriia bacterium]|jgi:hypothetical protein